MRVPRIPIATRRPSGRRRGAIVTLAAVVALIWPSAAFAAPANDDFADAQVIAEMTGSVTGSNVDATKETGEPDHAGNAGGRSIWFSWTAPADGNVAFTTAGSAFDTLLAVYTGAAVDALTLVAENDDDPRVFDFAAVTWSTVSFPVSSGVTYNVAVDGFSGKVGFVELHWHPAPANDNFADAQALANASGTITGDASGATLEVGEPPNRTGTVWYSWTPPVDGTYKFDTVGSRFDTVLAVYEGSSLDALTLVRRNDDDPDFGCCSSWVPIKEATAGTTYSIAVSSFDGDGGPLVLNWSPLILGSRAGEELIGTAEDEEIRGRGGPDILRGLGGDDALFGLEGNDQAYGAAGKDALLDLRGVDALFGGAGEDSLNTRDFAPKDLVAGGRGDDRCRVDRSDVARGCP